MLITVWLSLINSIDTADENCSSSGSHFSHILSTMLRAKAVSAASAAFIRVEFVRPIFGVS